MDGSGTSVVVALFSSVRCRRSRGEQLHHAGLERRRHYHLRGRWPDPLVLLCRRSHRGPGQAHEQRDRGEVSGVKSGISQQCGAITEYDTMN